ncbi:hypothetical protein [Spirosoma jeollabukense]
MKSTLFLTILFTGSLLTFSACQQESVPSQPGLPYQSSFQRDSDGWVAGITDYGTAQDSIMAFKSAYRGLPTPLDTTRKSLMLESMNRSDDAFMFIKKKVTGLQPNKDYSLLFEIELASKYGTNSVGIGGSPGGSVYLKAGASAVEPVKELKDGFYSLNVDKGDQNNDGTAAILLGNIGAGEDVTDYTLITRSNVDKPFTARTNAQGELWLLVGTDSGFEGLTTLYYSSIKVTTRSTN